MSTITKPPSKSARRRPASTLETTVLGALGEFGGVFAPHPTSSTDAPGKQKSRVYKRTGSKKSLAAKKAAFKKVLAQMKAGAATGDMPADMAHAVHNLRARLREQQLLTTQTIRVRSKGVDRKVVVEYSPDPEDPQSVLMRVSLASNAPLLIGEEMMTTQQAADVLNVSRPYVARLADAGKFSGVVRTGAGHRRIPRGEVERIKMEMRATRQAVMDDLANFGSESKVTASASAPKRRWVKV